MRLNDRQYYDRCIKGKHNGWYKCFHDGSVIKPTWDEWTTALALGKSNNTKLTLKCTTCAYSTNTSISDLQRGQGIACLCSHPPSLNDRQYYDRCIKGKHKDWYKCFHDGSVIKPTWDEWTSAFTSGKGQHSKSKLTLKCTTCAWSGSGSIRSLQSGCGIACLCSHPPSLNDRQYYDRCIEGKHNGWYKCFHDGSVITKPTWDEWTTALASGKGAHAKLTLKCTTCAWSGSGSINNLRCGQGISCLCSGKTCLNDRQYYDRCIKGKHKDWYKCFHDGSVIKPTWDEWTTALALGKGHITKLTLKCTTCTYSTNTSISDLQRGQGIACLCAMKKGAQAVSTFLETFTDLHWDKETRLYKNPKSGYYCPFDFTNAEHKIIVEADGQQHFQFIPFFHRSQSEFKRRVLIDREKERWAVNNGWLLIRVISEDALYDQHEWKDYIRSHIDTRVKNPIHSEVVVTPGTSDYIKRRICDHEE